MKVLITLLLLLGMSTFAYAQPKFEIEKGDTVNWGKLKTGNDQLTQKVIFKNLSKTDTLRIYNVKPGCGCTTAPLDRDRIPPGQTATLNVTLNVGGMSGDVHKTIDISTNDPENRHKTLHLKASVIQLLSLFPRFINFPDSKVNQSDTASVVLTNGAGVDIKIEEVSVEPADMIVDLKKGAVIPKNGTLKILAKYKPAEYGRFTGKVTFKTNHPDIVRETIQIHGFARENK
jgi:hypothetical protein